LTAFIQSFVPACGLTFPAERGVGPGAALDEDRQCQICGVLSSITYRGVAFKCVMRRRQHLVRLIQSLAAQEARSQPSAADWLWIQDKAGREMVELENAAQMRSWTEVFRVSREQLASAIDAVGTSADAIREYLAM